jgi:type 1 glutamine amidotransferase
VSPDWSKPVKVAVIEGFHPFEVPQFHAMFRSIPGIDYYPQTIENFAIDCAKCLADYDVLLFYNMNNDIPEGLFKGAIERVIQQDLGRKGQGIFLLHHAILSYPDNATFSEVVGIPNRKFWFHNEQRFRMDVATQDHPITRGMASMDMFDATYTMDSCGADSTPLFTTDYETSMKVLGWTRTYRDSRVFCFQPGHDHHAWETPGYTEIISRGILWCAGRL